MYRRVAPTVRVGVYNRAPNMESIISHQPLEYNRYLNKLVAWAWFNGLLTSHPFVY
jgi:adenylate cyclase class 1